MPHALKGIELHQRARLRLLRAKAWNPCLQAHSSLRQLRLMLECQPDFPDNLRGGLVGCGKCHLIYICERLAKVGPLLLIVTTQDLFGGGAISIVFSSHHCNSWQSNSSVSQFFDAWKESQRLRELVRQDLRFFRQAARPRPVSSLRRFARM